MQKFLSIFFILIFTSVLFSQSEQNPEQYLRYTDINMQPEVWHFMGPIKSDVDAKGDLHLNIPVLTVPGTNGMKFDINFSYKAGIRYQQTASWIGLGWNFDPGSITRDVVGNIKVNGVNYGVDYGNDISTFKWGPDAYYLTIPGKGTYPMRRTNIPNFNHYTSVDFLAPYQGEYGFFLENYQPFKIEYYVSNSYVWPGGYVLPFGSKGNTEDIYRFIITTEDGTKYIYGLPSLAIYYVPEGEFYYYYPNVWRLLAIVSPEFSGDIEKLIQKSSYDINAIGPDNAYAKLSNYKGWIKFEYAFNDNSIFSSGHASNSHLIQNTYLKYIITPTHYAEFITGNRYDYDLYHLPDNDGHQTFNANPLYKRLYSILLKNKSGLIIKKVTLEQDFSLAPGIFSDPDTGKLTLKGINFESYNGGKLPGYKFEYGDNPKWDYRKQNHYYDGFGYYNSNATPREGIDDNPDDAEAWSLKRITYPTGGSEEYEYENDKIDNGVMEYVRYYNGNFENVTFDFNTSIAQKSCRRQGGIRVTKIIKKDSVGNESVIEITYGKGYVPCVPGKLLPFANENMGLIYLNEFNIVNRGEQDVVYERIDKIYYFCTDHDTILLNKEQFNYQIGESYYHDNLQYGNGGKKHMILYQFYGGIGWTYIVDNNEIRFGIPWTTLRKRVVQEIKNYERECFEYKSFDCLNKVAAVLFPAEEPYNYQFEIMQISPRNTQEVRTKDRSLYGTPKQKIIITKEYSDTTRLIKSILTETRSRAMKEEFTYAYEIEAYGGITWQQDPNSLTGMRKENILNPIAIVKKSYVDKLGETDSSNYSDGECSMYYYAPETKEAWVDANDRNPGPNEDTTHFATQFEQIIKWKYRFRFENNGIEPEPDDLNYAKFEILEDGNIIITQFSEQSTQYTTVIDSGEFIGHPGKNYIIKVTAKSDGMRVTSQGWVTYNTKENNFIITSSKITSYDEIEKYPRDESGTSFVWKPIKKYQLKTNDKLCELPQFNNWDGEGIMDPAWQLVWSVDEYKFGELHKIRDANDNVITLYYGDNDNNFNNDDTMNEFCRSFLTALESSNGLTKQFDYDLRFMQVKQITDENNNTTKFIYDDFGRLKAILNTDNDTLNTYKYMYSRSLNNDQFSSSSPNYLRTRTFFSGTEFSDSYSFFDGLGQKIQNILTGDNFDLYSAFKLDAAGRQQKIYKPYAKDAVTQPAFDTEFENNSEGYTENHYISFLGNKIEKIDFPGIKSEHNSNQFFYDYVYASDILPEIFSESDSIVWYRKTTIDENLNKKYTYIDEFNEKILHEQVTKSNKIQNTQSKASIKTSSGYQKDVEKFLVDFEQQVTWELWTFFNPESNGAEVICRILENDVEIRSLSKSTSGTFQGTPFTAYPGRVYTIELIGEGPVGTLIEATGTTFYEEYIPYSLYTYFKYDGNSNITTIYPPKYFELTNPDDKIKVVTTYKYNTIGQMVEKTTPDGGTTKYKYDNNGNLRFVRDANHASDGINNVDINKEISFDDGEEYTENFTINKKGVLNWHLDFIQSPDLIELNFKILSPNGQVLVNENFDSGMPPKSGKVTVYPGEYSYKFTLNHPTGGEQWTISYYLKCTKAFEYVYYKYDELNRITEIGEYEGSISLDDADPSSDSPTTDKYAMIINKYDNGNGYPGSRNLNGKIAQTIYTDENTWKKGNIYYSYNDQGLVEWIVQDVFGLEKKIEYLYDLQGNVIKIIYDKDGPDEYYFWYEYNKLGQLEKVFTNGADIKPQNADAIYEYWPNGQVKTLKLGEKSDHSFAEVLEYTYTIRDWLSGINASNSIYEAAASDHKFGLKLYYDTPGLNGIPQYNGNISAAEYYTDRSGTTQENPTESYFYRYEYNYDELNRLISANYYYDEAFSLWVATNAYKVDNLSYDKMGNILTIKRRNESGSGLLYSYYYYPSTNQLKYVENLHTNSENFTYDLNGNLIGDVSKDIASGNITYDYRNLPTRVEFNNGQSYISYGYDFSGNRVYKKHLFSSGDSVGYKYILDKEGRTLAVYDLNGNLLFFNLYGHDLIGQISK